MNRRLLGILLLQACCHSSFAGAMGPTPMPPSWQYVASFSLGPIWIMDGDAQSLALTPTIVRAYTEPVANDVQVNGEVFLGFQMPMNPYFSWQLGAAVAATSNTAFTGEVWNNANPALNNFYYSYTIQHTHLAAKGKLLFNAGYRLIPWVGASVGVGWNQAYNFLTTPITTSVIPTTNFSNNTATAFTYTGEVGLQFVLNANWQLGASCQFADWGESQFGSIPVQTSSGGFTVDHVYTTGVLFNLTYLG